MTKKKQRSATLPVRNTMTPVKAYAGKESIFDRVVDYVSIEDVQEKLSEEVASNTALTQQVHELTSQIHLLLTATNGAPLV